MANSNKGTGPYFCPVCQINLPSEADLALHEFTKKHCDNLMRLAKNKPVKTKVAKTPAEATKDNSSTATQVVPPSDSVNIALYGYFTPDTQQTKPPEYNNEYDPYLQKLAENPYKAGPVDPTNVTPPPSGIVGFSKGSKKKKRLCQICNVTLFNIPQYDAHMKSPQHAWKLKVSGMGVSAHFVKASADLHTADVAAEENSGEAEAGTDAAAPASNSKTPVPVAPIELFCDLCGLLLNSVTQYQTHLAGKTHLDNVKIKDKVMNKTVPSPNKLFCYTCTLPLLDYAQYKDHKNGKKHKIKCRQLVREGITIPPEERPLDMRTSPYHNSLPVVYPDLYQSEVIDKKKAAKEKEKEKAIFKVPAPPPPAPAPPLPVPAPTPAVLDTTPEVPDPVPTPEAEKPKTTEGPTLNLLSGMYDCSKCTAKFSTAARLEEHLKSHGGSTGMGMSLQAAIKIIQSSPPTPPPVAPTPTAGATAGSPVIAAVFKCSICEITISERNNFDWHINSEEHAVAVQEAKKKEPVVKVLLAKLMADRRVIVHDRRGVRWCSICAVPSQTMEELEQHLESMVHKLADKDCEAKRFLELKEIVVTPEETGEIRCQRCKAQWALLTEFLAHLHTPTHRSNSKSDAGKKKWFQYNRKPYEEKNLGFRTKIGGTATVLSSGESEKVLNLEEIEPRIDAVKNVEIGVAPKKPYQGPMKKFVPSQLRGSAPRGFRGPAPWRARAPMGPMHPYGGDFRPPAAYRQRQPWDWGPERYHPYHHPW